MPYVTFKTAIQTAPQYKITDLLNGKLPETPTAQPFRQFHTIYRKTETMPETMIQAVKQMETPFVHFYQRWGHLAKEDMSEYYDTFHIPKASGGLRRIDAPKPELMQCLKELAQIMEYVCRSLPHNCAHAYTKQRSTLSALQVHKTANSKWFLKLDLKSFFPNCTFETVIPLLKQVYPYNLLFKESDAAMRAIFKLGFLNNSLPQGTPLSPILTNLIMIPIDEKIYRTLLNFKEQNYTYTRYADDLLISCKYKTNWQEVEQVVSEIVKPFIINKEKTRYGSIAGRNWNLGLMLNKDNNITTGHKQKQRLRAMINNYLTDLTKGITWNIMDIQVLQGLISYYYHIEPDYINYIKRKYAEKFSEKTLDDIFKTNAL